MQTKLSPTPLESKEGRCKQLGCPRDEFDLFLSEARTLNFANVRDMSTEHPQLVRIESRRMLRGSRGA
jgi:hypothetical protein